MRARVCLAAILLVACSEYADDPIAPGVVPTGGQAGTAMNNAGRTGGNAAGGSGGASAMNGGASAGGSGGAMTMTGGAGGRAGSGGAMMSGGAGAGGSSQGGSGGAMSVGGSGGSGGSMTANGGASGMTTGGQGGNAGMAAGGSGGTMTGEPAQLAGITEAHNVERRMHALPDLVWDPALAAIAQTWAQTCTDGDAPIGLLDHNPNRAASYGSSVGENIYGHSQQATAAAAVGSWIAEKADYTYATNTCAAMKVCGHYTQVVWRNTLKVGCAIHDCAGLTYRHTIVCDYAPAGNVSGQKPY